MCCVHTGALCITAARATWGRARTRGCGDSLGSSSEVLPQPLSQRCPRGADASSPSASALAAVVEALVRATRGRCEELSADDLVPLMVLAFVGARVGEGVLAFEAFVLDECVTGVVSFGKESYCACTAAVALGFLRQLRLDDDLP